MALLRSCEAKHYCTSPQTIILIQSKEIRLTKVSKLIYDIEFSVSVATRIREYMFGQRKAYIFERAEVQAVALPGPLEWSTCHCEHTITFSYGKYQNVYIRYNKSAGALNTP